MRRINSHIIAFLKLIVIAGGFQCIAAQPVLAQASMAPSEVARSISYAGEMLLAQATYWWRHGSPQKAMASLTQLLDHEPNSADGLAMLAEIAAEQGQGDVARANLEHLHQTHPDDPRLPRLDLVVKRGVIDPQLLAKARAALQAGRSEEAVGLYRQAMHGDVPPSSMAREFYSALGNTDQGFQDAVTGMAKLVTDDPSDLLTQLAYAQLLTVQDASREEGVTRLTALQDFAPVANEAATSLHQSLLGLPNDTRSIPYFEAYLKRHPDDTEIQQRLGFVRNPVLTPEVAAARARDKAFAAIKANRLGEAEAAFQQALAVDADDADALGGMGLIRARQNRLPEARTLLTRAATLDLQWEDARKSLDAAGIASTAASTAARDAAIRGYAQVQRLANQGDTVEAEQQLLKLMNGGGNVGNFVQLGSIQAIGGRLPDAETSFRRALSMEPTNKDAISGLANVLVRQGHDAEVTAMLPSLSPAQRQTIEHAQAEKLRTAALATNAPAARSDLLRQAVALDPANPWLRFAYAQALQKQGLAGNARQVMGDVAQVDVNDPQAVQAQLAFAQQSGNDDRALILITRVPPSRWTQQMRDLFDSSQLRQQIQQATASGSPVAVSSRLQALAGQPDPTGDRTAAIARALIRAHDRTTASKVLRDALRNLTTPRQSLAYASVLLELGLDRDARSLVRGTNPATLPPDLQQVRGHLLDGIAIRQSDRLNEQGQGDEAMKALAPRIAESPGQPAVDMARARVLQQQGNSDAALLLDKSVLQRDQTDLDARAAAVQAALGAGEDREARRLVAEGLAMAPDDPRAHLMAARLAQSRGDNGTALREYEAARVTRSKQLAQMRAAP